MLNCKNVVKLSTHSNYCDGKGELKDYLEAGKKAVLGSIGFSSHAPIPITCNQKKSADTYPSPWILDRIYELNIPITLSSDAHHPDDLINQFQQTASLLNDIGFKNLSILKDGIWKQMPFNQYGIIL